MGDTTCYATVDVSGVGSHTLEFWSVDGPYRAEDRKSVDFTIE
jgi:hypothetical protein